ncbi:hypothetical protein [Celerinatantimonas sp. YJH-8]|uniref:hypothetical protein n=1 Tax=Celerinatantimonas sp. YJH-8 TaxID=3228714 RepID=UPI0038C99C96
MNIFYYNDFPHYAWKKYIPVRDPIDNLSNILTTIELIVNYPEKQVSNADNGFDIIVFTKDSHRFLVKSDCGYFSMTNPFQVNLVGDNSISFSLDPLEGPVDGKFISAMRNAIKTIQNKYYSHDDIVLSLSETMHMDFPEANQYTDTFVTLLSEDHGYFRFDDDPDHENKNIHPRYHFDVFFKNTNSIKIGYDQISDINCFLSLTDKNKPKKYLYNYKK